MDESGCLAADRVWLFSRTAPDKGHSLGKRNFFFKIENIHSLRTTKLFGNEVKSCGGIGNFAKNLYKQQSA